MAKKRVLVDLDDTLTATQAMLIKAAKNMCDGSVVFPLYNEFAEDHFTNPKSVWRQVMVPVFRHPEIVLKVKPYKNALEALKLLSQNGYEVHLFSAREEEMHGHTDSWLRNYGFAPYITEVHRRFHPTPVSEFKLTTAKKVLPAACFDDRKVVAEILSQNGFPVYLIRRPWNFEVKRTNHIAPHNSFHQAVQAFLRSSH